MRPGVLVLLICMAYALALSLPTIANNMNDPNRIVYMNADEGGLMDEVWYYYSGTKRDSFQWDFDYGIEMMYLAYIARAIFSKFAVFTPGLFVVILRIIHLSAWILSFFVAWKLIGRHFGKGWQQPACVALLACRPAFAYFSINIKPEPLVLLIMILGIDYSLRIIDAPSKKNIIAACAMASLAFVIKFAGVFLLTMIVACLYLARGRIRGVFAGPYKISWIFPAMIGIFIIALPLIPLSFYVRKSTGMTWAAEYGLWGSMMRNSLILPIWGIGAVLVLSSVVLLMIRNVRIGSIERISDFINRINSFAILAVSLFAAFLMLFGVGWVFMPDHLITIYGQLGPIASEKAQVINIVKDHSVFYYLSMNLIRKLISFDILIISLLALYIAMEIANIKRNLAEGRVVLYKRIALIVFILPFIVSMFSSLRSGSHTILPFFVAASILCTQGIDMAARSPLAASKKINPVYLAAGLLLLIDIVLNAAMTGMGRAREFNQHEDISYAAGRWIEENIGGDESVVADNYNRVYIPDTLRQVKAIKWNEPGRLEPMQRLVERYRPRYVYFNERPNGDTAMPAIRAIVSGRKARLVKSFRQVPGRYQKNPNDSFVIYEVQY